MLTPPDGDVAGDADVPVGRRPAQFREVNSGDDASILYHEYTHGLSNRLVTDAVGRGRAELGAGGRDGRGLGRLVREGLPRQPVPRADTGAAGRARHGRLHRPDAEPIRNQPLDCPVGASAVRSVPRRAPPARAASRTATSARSTASPRSTATARSGRRRCGTCARRSASQDAERLITQGMRLSPPEPSFLDMRNAILAGRRRAGHRPPQPDLDGVREPRHGLLRLDDRRRRRLADRGLLAAARGRAAARPDRGRA